MMTAGTGRAVRRWLRDNGLFLANFGLFAVFLVGLALTGWHAYNGNQAEHQQAAVGLWRYLHTGDFVEAVFENWESEFLQMGSYVLLTAYLFQRGSAESKDPDQPNPQDANAEDADKRRDVPWPVRRGGWVLKLYENSLLLFFVVMFLLSFVLHALGGAAAYNEDQQAHGEAAVSLGKFLQTAQFWDQSMQNWQSEFLAVASIVLVSVWLRQRGSAESKPVAAPHSETGA